MRSVSANPTSDPGTRALGYVPALDGVRALAVLAVVLFHAGFGWASGGFLGVSVFFTLSGFLITSLLLAEYSRDRRVSLTRFYARRARRLLPAAYMCLALVLAAAPWWSPMQRRRLPGDVLAAVGNFYNWRAAWSSLSYRELFDSAPSPVAHFWSLSIEEQCYLILPLVTVAALRWGGHRWLTAVGASLLAGTLLAALATPDFDVAYNATFTRGGEVLVGMVLAALLRGRRVDGEWSDAVGLVSVAGLLAGIALLDLGDEWLARGGLVGAAILTCGLIVGVLGRGPLAVLFAWRPLVSIGRVSYGVYLYHWLVFLVFTEQRSGLDRLPLLAVRGVVTAALAVASFKWLENPIRERRWFATSRRGGVAIVSALAVLLVGVQSLPVPQMSATERLLADVGRDPVILNPDQSDPAEVSASIPQAPPRVLVVGSNPHAVRVLDEGGLGIQVVDRVHVGCPAAPGAAAMLVSGEVVETGRCTPAGDLWEAAARQIDPDLVVVSFGAIDDGLVRVTADEPFPSAGDSYRRVEMVDRARVDVSSSLLRLVADGTRVLLYWPVDGTAPPVAFRDYSIYSGLIDGPFDDPASLLAAVDGALAPERTATHTRLLVVGDSTSYLFALALSKVSSSIDVQWAGRAGCPLVQVDALQPWAEGEWTEPDDCPDYEQLVPELVARFHPDAVLVVVGAMELNVQRYPGDSTAYPPGSDGYFEAHDHLMQRLLDALGPGGPLVVVTDAPPIAPGPFSSPEVSTPERLAGLNAQIRRWADRHPEQVRLLPYSAPLLAYEAEFGSIRSDGSHPDPDQLALILRDSVVPVLLDLIAQTVNPT